MGGRRISKKTWGLASVIGFAIGISLFASPSIGQADQAIPSVSVTVRPSEITPHGGRWSPLDITPGGPDSEFRGPYTAILHSNNCADRGTCLPNHSNNCADRGTCLPNSESEDANLANLRDVMGGSTETTFPLGNEIAAPVPESLTPSTVILVFTMILGIAGWSLRRNRRTP
jgi:hypothetical protein